MLALKHTHKNTGIPTYIQTQSSLSESDVKTSTLSPQEPRRLNFGNKSAVIETTNVTNIVTT